MRRYVVIQRLSRKCVQNKIRTIRVPVVLNGVTHSMELDTGAAITVISEAECQELFPGAMLRKSDLLLETYTGEPLPVIGELNVQVRYEEQENDLALTVIEGDGPSLLG